MATESDLRDLLQGPDPEGRAAIDVDSVLARARRRRRPRVIVAQALGSVAAVGVLVTGVAVTLPQAGPASLMVAEDSAGGSEEIATAPESADHGELRIGGQCGLPVAAVDTLDAPVTIVEPLAAETGSDRIPATVVLRNDGAQPITGVSSAPVLTVSREGVVVAEASAVESIGFEVDLAPGDSLAFESGLFPVQCDPDDPTRPIGALAALPPGDYEVRASVGFTAADGTGSVFVGPASPLVIR